MNWTNERCAELNKLHRLLTEVSCMNHGSDIVRRIQECERLANDLLSTDIGAGRESFYQFLIGLAADERHRS